jgi:two-component system, OmpR family, alkaline phosphatase synthesis response regulator PhoP
VKKILIVDDEWNARRLVRFCLEEEPGFELHEAEDGTEALKKAKELKPDLVILDLMMPDMWGYAVCEEIKKTPETLNTIVLVLTARGSGASKVMGEMKGADSYMVKPFEPKELRDKVKNLLGQE